MLEVDLGQYPVCLMVMEAFMELQISDKVKEVLKVNYPQDPTPEYADVECDCSGNESEEEREGAYGVYCGQGTKYITRWLCQ